MLRRALLAWGVFCLVVAFALFVVFDIGLVLGVYLMVVGAVTVAGIVFERHRYRPRLDRTRGAWQPTGERFIDPTTGRMTEVRYNSVTGEREYVETPTRR